MSIFKIKAKNNDKHCHCGCEQHHEHAKNGVDNCNCACTPDCTCGCQEGQPCTCNNDCACNEGDEKSNSEPERQQLSPNSSKEFSISAKNIKLLSKKQSFCSKPNNSQYHHETHGDITKVHNCGNETCKLKNNCKPKSLKEDKISSCGCGRCEETKVEIVNSSLNNLKENFIKLLPTVLRLTASIILLLLGIFLNLPKYFNLAFFIPSFLFAGGQYVFKAIKNIAHGKIFDENFLMTLASIGAFCIGEYPEGIAVMLLYSIGEMLQDFAVNKSKRNIAEMLNLKTPFANKLLNGQLLRIPTDDVKIGDNIVVANGEKIPVDGIVLDGESFADNSMLSGEYKPVRVSVGDEILGGGILKGSAITIQATKLFKDTSASKIIELVQNAQDKKPKSQQFITKFAKFYTPFVVFAALFIALIPPAILGFQQNFSQYLNKALVFLVISCPCALVISVPLGFFAGIGGASKRGILFKGGNYLESLNSIDTFAFDKTGTLTEGVFEVSEISPIDINKSTLLEICAYAESKSNHPIAESIRKAYNAPIIADRINDYNEQAGFGISLKLDNDFILCGSVKLMEKYNVEIQKSSANGTVIYIAKNGIYCGNIVINDKIKEDSFAIINKLLTMKKNVILLSGDRKESVTHVAKQLGIVSFYSELLPQDKANIISGLLNDGKKVAFIGDGLNDAPVLKLSTIGVCMSGLNNDASIEAADLILSNGNIGGLSTAINSAKKTRAVVSINIAMSLITKAVIMILSLTILPSMWLALVADVGVSLLAILNSTRAMKVK